MTAPLEGDLSLATLAGIACFPPYHFHRVFAASGGGSAFSARAG